MVDEPKDTYGIESSSSPPGAGEGDAAATTGGPRIGRPIESGSSPAAPREPLPLEDEDEVPHSMRSVRSLDVCPNCGANMANTNDVVCLRCGFDLKTMKQVKTATGQVEVGGVGAGAEGDGEGLGGSLRKPLVVEGMGGVTAPLIAAAAAGAILALGYLAGIGGLFPPVVNTTSEVVANPEIAFAMRLTGLLRTVISIGMWTGCGLGALTFLAYLNGLRLGDARLAASRMLGIAAVMHLARFLNVRTAWIEWTLESVAQAAIFAALSMVLFNLKPKDTPILVGAAIILFLAIWLCALAVVWGAA